MISKIHIGQIGYIDAGPVHSALEGYKKSKTEFWFFLASKETFGHENNL